MANEANSRDTVPNFRWGETAGGAVVSANVVEPSSGKKDTGWVPGVDGIVGEWWNWLHWAARVAFRYLENWLELDLPYNHVLTDAAGTEGVVTDGVGLSVNVSSARCWINGAMYTVPAATNLALAAADPTDPRLDLVYARTTGSPAVPSYAVVTGTPDPGLPTPALPAGGCAIATVRVNALGVVPNTKTSVREFGGIEMDRIIARKRFDVGDPDDPTVTIRDTLGLIVGDLADPTFFAAPDDVIQLKPELFGFTGGASITRKFDVDATEIRVDPAALGAGLDLQTDGTIKILTGGTAFVFVGVRVPKGSIITAVRAYGEKAGTGDGMSIELTSREKADGTNTSLVTNDNTGVGTGDFTLTATLSHAVDQSKTYWLKVARDAGSGDMFLRAVEVEYDVANPFTSF